MGCLLLLFKGIFPEEIASLKIAEAISIDKDIDNILANFEEPGKAGLISFMEKNFMFNMPLEKFGYLTGRSLTTFKRDFKKSFHTTPQKWLMRKRLELAHYELPESIKNRSMYAMKPVLKTCPISPMRSRSILATLPQN